jgi:hypothetical protein
MIHTLKNLQENLLVVTTWIQLFSYILVEISKIFLLKTHDGITKFLLNFITVHKTGLAFLKKNHFFTHLLKVGLKGGLFSMLLVVFFNFIPMSNKSIKEN